MRILRLAAIIIGLTWTGQALAQSEMPSDAGIEATITAQIDAFLKDDFAEAFSFASPNIQGMFGNSDRFGQMVRNGYPMVWRPDDVQYLELREIQGNLWQKVLIRDQAGAMHVLDYQMIQTENGWKINGVQILKRPGFSA
ncbi:MAG: DUF4864 domain-containing protein [Paracoccaceae bacterium]|nr:DUF4864 domain-containing protein [Paracoccaceae bacterium]